MLIVKRGRSTWKKKDLENRIIEYLRTDEIKIIRRENKETAKVLFKSKREKEAVWERKKKALKRKYNMLVDELLTIEERKERCIVRESNGAGKEV